MRPAFLVLLFLLSGSHCRAQLANPAREWSLGLGYGGIIAHNQVVKHLAQSHPFQLNLDFLQQEQGGSSCNRYGMALHYIDYQSGKLGKSLASLLFFEPRLSKNLYLRIGSGVGWNSRPFHLETNPGNNMMGSAFAGAMQGRILLNSEIKKSLRFKFGLGITHFSNGSYSLPNMGINHFYLFSSLGFLQPQPALAGSDLINQRKGLVAGFSVSASLVERFPLSGKKYPVWQLQTRLGFQNKRRSVFSTGLDLMYNAALASRIKEFPEEGTSVLMTGIPLSHSWRILPSWSILTEAGIYLFRHNRLYPALYQRYGFRYQLSGGISAGLLLKTHLAKAECLEINLSYFLLK
jgi:hypothetical protein